MEGKFILEIDCRGPCFANDIPGGWRRAVQDMLFRTGITLDNKTTGGKIPDMDGNETGSFAWKAYPPKAA